MGSKLAMITATRATDPGLKTLGSNLVKDFIRMGSQLKPAVSGEKGYQWSDKPAPEDQHTLDGLDRLSGGELDAALRRQLVALMERMDAVFSTEAAKGSDADLKPFAQRSAPWIKERLKQARSLDHQQD
jgi:putative membrane protein